MNPNSHSAPRARAKTRSPLIDLARMIRAHSIERPYLVRSMLYVLKFACFEPFRQLEKLFFEKKIAKWKLKEDPIFILGYYRSGTTHLQEILLQDQAFGYLNFYRCFFQNGFLVTEPILKTFLNWFIRLTRFKHPAHGIPFHFGLPGEEDVSMVSSGFYLASNWGQIFPKSFRRLYAKTAFFEGITPEEREHFRSEYVRLVNRVSIAENNRRLLLKSPPHTGRIAMLKSLYPKAKFIFIYRNPYEVFKSNQKLWRSFRGQALQGFEAPQADLNIIWSFNKTLDFFENEKSAIQDDLIELKYEEFMADPLKTIQKIYQEFGLEGYELTEPKFRAYIERMHGANVDRYEYKESELRLVEKNWSKWLKKWNYNRPDTSAEPLR